MFKNQKPEKKNNNITEEKIPWYRRRFMGIIKKIIGVVIIYILALVATIILLVLILKILKWKSENISDEFIYLITLFLGNLTIAWWLKFRKAVGIFLLSLILMIVILFYTPANNFVVSYIRTASQMCDANIAFPIAQLIILPFLPLCIIILLSRITRNRITHHKITNLIKELILGIISFTVSIIVIMIMVSVVHAISGGAWCGT